jgi:SSS family solute:Na+ symporter
MAFRDPELVRSARMSGRVLGALQVAVMLIAASYGIGFLFGSGEAALTQGIAGGLYGVATAAGMLALAVVAKPLWRSGVPVWDLFGAAFGPASQVAVALLSLLWMAGVLAAQVHGGTAVLGLLGLASPWNYAVVLVLIYGASRLDLRLASAVFSVCLLASAMVLAYALFASGGASIYAGALPRFVADLGRIEPQKLVASTLAVGVLVCLGADYHQFVVAGRSASAAAWGCLLASVGLVMLALLPPAVVVAMEDDGALDSVAESKQIIPFILSRVAHTFGPGADKLMLAALMAAALGSGAAILRAMTSALSSALPGRKWQQHPALGVVALAIGAALAARGQGIVDTMVSINLVYIASVALPFAALVLGVALSPREALFIMGVGFAGSGAAYGFGWLGWLSAQADLMSLLLGLGMAGLAASVCGLRRRASPRSAVVCR